VWNSDGETWRKNGGKKYIWNMVEVALNQKCTDI
jgi:hypothetical protein